MVAEIEIPNSDVIEARSGDWRIERFTVSEDDARFHNLRCAINARRGYGRSITAGTYTALKCNGQIIMSDTPAEKRDHRDFVRRAKGKVLINGLGLGMCAVAVLLKPEVEHVVIVEKSPDVLRLVANHVRAKFPLIHRLDIVGADAFDFTPPKGMRFDVVWHDIWADICGDNVAEMTALKRKYARRCDWQGCWCEEEMRGAV